MRRTTLDAMRKTLLAGATLLAGCAGTVHAPYPPIRADLSPAALERGAAIFHASCESCHRGGDAETASGAPLRELEHETRAMRHFQAFKDVHYVADPPPRATARRQHTRRSEHRRRLAVLTGTVAVVACVCLASRR